MFGIDFSEILVIFVIALVVLGPEKLPKLAQNIGRWVGRARAMARQFREQLEQEAETLRRDTDPHIHHPFTAEQMMPDPPAPERGPVQPPDTDPTHGTSTGAGAASAVGHAAASSAALESHEPGP